MIITSTKKNAERVHEVLECSGTVRAANFIGVGDARLGDTHDESREFHVSFDFKDLPALRKIVEALTRISTVLAVVFFFGCGKPVAPPASECAAPNGHFLYVFGDSITYSLDGNSYANMMGCEKGYHVVNMAVGGTSIEFGNQYGMIMAHQRNWIKGDVVVFSPGENDAVLYAHDAAHVADYTSKVHDIVTMMAGKQVQIYFGTPNLSCDEARFGPNSDREVYAQISRAEVAAQNASNIHIVDFTANFLPTAEATYDCLHPNGIGNKIMAGQLTAEMN